MSINQSVIVGRLTRDPELKQTGSGFPFVNFCVAVDRPYKSGEEKQCDFIDCTAWRASAEFLAKWFRKGSPIGIVGRIQTRNFQTQDGQKRKATEIVVDNISFVGNSGGGNQNNAAPYAEPGCNAAPAPSGEYAGYSQIAPGQPAQPVPAYQPAQPYAQQPQGGFATNRQYAGQQPAPAYQQPQIPGYQPAPAYAGNAAPFAPDPTQAPGPDFALLTGDDNELPF